MVPVELEITLVFLVRFSSLRWHLVWKGGAKVHAKFQNDILKNMAAKCDIAFRNLALFLPVQCIVWYIEYRVKNCELGNNSGIS